MARDRGGAHAFKVVITGPLGAGKTTLITTISETAVLSHDEPAGGAADATVALDFGRITIDDELVLYVFGTPGEQRVDIEWKLLSEGMLGVVVMVDGDRPESAAEAAGMLDHLLGGFEGTPHVVAVNKLAGPDAAVLDDVRGRMGLEARVQVLACDARDRESVKQVLLTLLHAAVEAQDAEARPALT
jgi:signal recognition particle receptor subunit beta